MERQVIIENDKDLGAVEHKFSDIFVEFNGVETTLTLSHDRIIEVD